MTRHSRGQLPGSAVGHMDNGRGSLIHHHLVFVPQAALNEVEQGTVMTEKIKDRNQRRQQSASVQMSLCVATITAGLLTLPLSRPAVCWRS